MPTTNQTFRTLGNLRISARTSQQRGIVGLKGAEFAAAQYGGTFNQVVPGPTVYVREWAAFRSALAISGNTYGGHLSPSFVKQEVDNQFYRFHKFYGSNIVRSFISSSSQYLRSGSRIVGFEKAGVRSDELIISGPLAKYLLFRFPVASHYDYGWLELTASPDSLLDVVAYAYDPSGNPIPAGAVPEPRELPLALSALTLGALGLREWRKSRTKPPA